MTTALAVIGQQASRYDVSRTIRTQASLLQRKGLTLSEIAATLGYQRGAIIQILYDEKVKR